MGLLETRQTRIAISRELIEEIDALVGRRGRGAFIIEAAQKELIRLRQIKALEALVGSGKTRTIPR
jgi:hypothetical protein